MNDQDDQARRDIVHDLQRAVAAALVLSLIEEAGGEMATGDLCDALNDLGATDDLSPKDLGLKGDMLLRLVRPC